MQHGRIKSRVLLFTLTIFVVSIWGLTYFASRILRTEMQQVLSDQQLSIASFIAGDITDQLTFRMKVLENAAPFHAKSIGNPAAAQTLLSSRVTLLSLFNGDVAVSDKSGTVIAASTPTLVGANFMARDYLVSALQEGKSTISDPLFGKISKTPVFVMVVPIRNAQGKIVGALAGVTDLAKENFLDNIGRNHYGKTGAFLVVSRSLRQIIAASDKAWVMETPPAPGTVPHIDRFLEGVDGSGIFVNPKGVEVLQSAKLIPVANWYAAVQTPISEAFGPIYVLHQHLLLVVRSINTVTK